MVSAPGVIFDDTNTAAPDLVWITAEKRHQIDRAGHLVVAPDLMIEILSPGKRNEQRDREDKLEMYGQFRVAEYWIVDWRAWQVDVYRHDGQRLREAATLRPGETLTSPLLPGFASPIGDLFPTAGQARPS